MLVAKTDRNVFSADLPDATVAERFDKYLGPKGLKKGYAVRGALELFMCLPSHVREMLIEGRVDEAKAWLAEGTAAGLVGDMNSLVSAAHLRVDVPASKGSRRRKQAG